MEANHYQNIAQELLEVEKRNLAFWEMLNHFFGSPRKGRATHTPITILNVACGICEEANVLCSFFSSGILGLPTAGATLIGIDQNEMAIQRAKMLARVPSSFNDLPVQVIPNCEFIVGDASRLERYPAIPAALDLIVIRHQYLMVDIEHRIDLWSRILIGSLKRLKPTGKLLLTSFSANENRLLLWLLSSVACDVVTNQMNPYALQYPGNQNVAFDQYITIVKQIKD